MDDTAVGDVSDLGERILKHMRLHGIDPTPAAYERTYALLTGQAAEGGPGPAGPMDQAFTLHAEKSGASLLSEMDAVLAMLDVALSSTHQYGQSLAAISDDLSHELDLHRVREIVVRLASATRDTLATNALLESRLRETRSEVQDLRETLEAIRTESLTDPLTTLANRKHLDRTLLQAIDHAAISGEPLTLLMIDVDKFKDFNDTWGHLTGDQVLRLVAMSIKGAVRPSDTPARFGGEEFAIVLPQSTLKGGLLVAERIRQTVRGRQLVKRSTGEALGRLTVSVGIASFAPGDTAALLLDRADRCLLEAKRNGRNRCVTEADLPRSYPNVA